MSLNSKRPPLLENLTGVTEQNRNRSNNNSNRKAKKVVSPLNLGCESYPMHDAYSEDSSVGNEGPVYSPSPHALQMMETLIASEGTSPVDSPVLLNQRSNRKSSFPRQNSSTGYFGQQSPSHLAQPFLPMMQQQQQPLMTDSATSPMFNPYEMDLFLQAQQLMQQQQQNAMAMAMMSQEFQSGMYGTPNSTTLMAMAAMMMQQQGFQPNPLSYHSGMGYGGPSMGYQGMQHPQQSMMVGQHPMSDGMQHETEHCLCVFCQSAGTNTQQPMSIDGSGGSTHHHQQQHQPQMMYSQQHEQEVHHDISFPMMSMPVNDMAQTDGAPFGHEEGPSKRPQVGMRNQPRDEQREQIDDGLHTPLRQVNNSSFPSRNSDRKSGSAQRRTPNSDNGSSAPRNSTRSDGASSSKGSSSKRSQQRYGRTPPTEEKHSDARQTRGANQSATHDQELFQVVLEGKLCRQANVASYHDVPVGSHVIYEGDRGEELGRVVTVSARPQKTSGRTSLILRPASADEVQDFFVNQRRDEEIAMVKAAEVAKKARLPMTLTNAAYQFDKKKLTLFYVTDVERVDFRSYVRDLYNVFLCRIWMEKDPTMATSDETQQFSQEHANKKE